MQNEMHRFSPLEVVRGFLKASPARAFGLVGALALAGALAGIGMAFAATTTRAPSVTESVDPEDALPESAPSPSPSGSPTAGPEETASDQTPEGQPPPEGQAPSGGLTESPPAATAPPAPEPVPDTTPPAISVGSLPAVIAVDVGCPASGFVVTATDASGVASFEVNDDHPDVWVSQYWRDGDRFGFSGNGQWPTWPYYSVGHAQVVTAVIVATDSVGNQSSVTRTFNYYDYSSNCDET